MDRETSYDGSSRMSMDEVFESNGTSNFAEFKEEICHSNLDNMELVGKDNEEDNFGEHLGEYALQELNAWEQRQRMAIVNLLCHIIRVVCLMKMYYHSRCVNTLDINDIGDRVQVRHELMQELTEVQHCRNVLRMGPSALFRLCGMLRRSRRLKDTRNSSVEEQVAKFLYILGHNERTRPVGLWFRRSRETISCQFHGVLRAIISLEDSFLKQPNGFEVPPQILNSNRFYPYFKVIYVISFLISK
ncbi:hypothetical protein REPUB_Repub09cG0064800 [Reevesia pubescens]